MNFGNWMVYVLARFTFRLCLFRPFLGLVRMVRLQR